MKAIGLRPDEGINTPRAHIRLMSQEAPARPNRGAPACPCALRSRQPPARSAAALRVASLFGWGAGCWLACRVSGGRLRRQFSESRGLPPEGGDVARHQGIASRGRRILLTASCRPASACWRSGTPSFAGRVQAARQMLLCVVVWTATRKSGQSCKTFSFILPPPILCLFLPSPATSFSRFG